MAHKTCSYENSDTLNRSDDFENISDNGESDLKNALMEFITILTRIKDFKEAIQSFTHSHGLLLNRNKPANLEHPSVRMILALQEITEDTKQDNQEHYSEILDAFRQHPEFSPMLSGCSLNQIYSHFLRALEEGLLKWNKAKITGAPRIDRLFFGQWKKIFKSDNYEYEASKLELRRDQIISLDTYDQDLLQSLTSYMNNQAVQIGGPDGDKGVCKSWILSPPGIFAIFLRDGHLISKIDFENGEAIPKQICIERYLYENKENVERQEKGAIGERVKPSNSEDREQNQIKRSGKDEVLRNIDTGVNEVEKGSNFKAENINRSDYFIYCMIISDLKEDEEKFETLYYDHGNQRWVKLEEDNVKATIKRSDYERIKNEADEKNSGSRLRCVIYRKENIEVSPPFLNCVKPNQKVTSENQAIMPKKTLEGRFNPLAPIEFAEIPVTESIITKPLNNSKQQSLGIKPQEIPISKENDSSHHAVNNDFETPKISLKSEFILREISEKYCNQSAAVNDSRFTCVSVIESTIPKGQENLNPSNINKEPFQEHFDCCEFPKDLKVAPITIKDFYDLVSEYYNQLNAWMELKTIFQAEIKKRKSSPPLFPALNIILCLNSSNSLNLSDSLILKHNVIQGVIRNKKMSWKQVNDFLTELIQKQEYKGDSTLKLVANALNLSLEDHQLLKKQIQEHRSLFKGLQGIRTAIEAINENKWVEAAVCIIVLQEELYDIIDEAANPSKAGAKEYVLQFREYVEYLYNIMLLIIMIFIHRHCKQPRNTSQALMWLELLNYYTNQKKIFGLNQERCLAMRSALLPSGSEFDDMLCNRDDKKRCKGLTVSFEKSSGMIFGKASADYISKIRSETLATIEDLVANDVGMTEKGVYDFKCQNTFKICKKIEEEIHKMKGRESKELDRLLNAFFEDIGRVEGIYLAF